MEDERKENVGQPPRQTTQEKVLEATRQMERELLEVYEKVWLPYLDMVSRFPHYSVNNNLLILSQKPDAQLIAGMKKWNSMGRKVNKGEKAIRILAPTPYKTHVAQPKKDQKGKTVTGTDGKVEMEWVEMQKMGFKITYVYDVAQTSGKPVPEFRPRELTGDVDQYNLLLEALKQAAPCPVTVQEIKREGVKGFYSPTLDKIVINEGMSQEQTLKTLAHEVCHAYCDSPGSEHTDRATKEVRAESTAYIVCKAFGIDTTDYSTKYIIGYASGREMKELHNNLRSIQSTSAIIIDKVENYIKENTETEEIVNELLDEKEQAETWREGGQSESACDDIKDAFTNEPEDQPFVGRSR